MTATAVRRPGADDTCWFCNDELRLDPPPGGWLYDDAIWRAGHTPASYSAAGTVIVESHRHVVDESAMDEREAATLVGVVGRVVTAIREATGCDRVYHWATMDAYAHYHLWLIPWFETSATRGPRHLVETVVDGEGCGAAEATRAAERIRAALSPA